MGRTGGDAASVKSPSASWFALALNRARRLEDSSVPCQSMYAETPRKCRRQRRQSGLFYCPALPSLGLVRRLGAQLSKRLSPQCLREYFLPKVCFPALCLASLVKFKISFPCYHAQIMCSAG